MKTTMKLLMSAATFAAVAAAQAEPVTYVVEPTHTFVTFEAKHFGTSTLRGRWDKKEGQVTIDRAAKTGRAQITIDMSSINTGTDAFNKHLSSKDFFNVEANPKSFFVAEKFTFDGDKVSELTGELTIAGKSGAATLKATSFNCYNHPMLKKEVCGGDFETTIKRSDWGITYGVPFIPDNVHLLIQIEAIKQ
jgi:polyisoprenoid-binding protein YceI